jgi:5-formyltetrahydrofolate cyclo-ligase
MLTLVPFVVAARTAASDSRMTDMTNDKATARSRLANRRYTQGSQSRTAEAAAAVRLLLAAPEMSAARRIAAYVGLDTEPATDGLLASLTGSGRSVLLPLLRDDRDLDWAEYTGPDLLVAGRYGLREPSGPRLGTGAVLTVDVVVVPALAVDARGTRLGRGGGSYDRVLARLAEAPERPWTVALLYPWEVVVDVPVESHDRHVDAAVSSRGVVRFTSTG